jgi:rhodanese-related sulfurtransferase
VYSECAGDFTARPASTDRCYILARPAKRPKSVMSQILEFVGHHPILIGGLLLAWTAVMFYEMRLRAGGVTHVSAADAVRLINKGALVIDVRESDDFVAGHIVNARNVALEKIQEDQDSIAKKKDKILLAVCDNGGLSGKAASLLRKAGYQNAFSLRGGIAGWRADNLPLVK